jgi:predicted O-methyltransferase YrrM
MDAAADLYRLIDGYKITQAIHAAAVLGLADRIAAGVSASADLAHATGVDGDALYRLLRALGAMGVVHEGTGRQFSLTPMGEALRSDAEVPLAPFAILTGQTYYWDAWGQLLQGVVTGENVFRAVHGTGTWAYREAHPEQDAIFNAAMTANARRANPAVVDAIDARGLTRVADIGGGQGALLAALVARHPHLRGVLFDRPSVIASAAPLLASAGVADRVEVVGGDMLVSVPAGADAYVLKFVLHDWDDDDATAILRACRRAMTSTSALLVVERLAGAPNADLAAKLSDLNMLVIAGGRERTRDEFAALLAAGGFRLVRVDDTAGDLKVIVGAPE